MAKNSQAVLDLGQSKRARPLADRLRPSQWNLFEGIEGLDQNLLTQIRDKNRCPCSLILWGPPGSGKTTLAKIIGASVEADFLEISAVLSGVKEIREITASALNNIKPTILFVDEIHRFNKSQQDAFLPHIENGTIILIGATTENPSFYLTQALLSRVKVLVLPALSEASMLRIAERGFSEFNLTVEQEAQKIFIEMAAGDARKLLAMIELYGTSNFATNKEHSVAKIREFLSSSFTLYYDRDGEEHYNMVSAFIKSMRGSDADASLYWGFRMIESGEDPRFIIRRLMIFASEDIGNADPRALQLAVATAEAFDRLGLPEGKIPIAHCITYLATAPKSNRSYLAMHRAIDAVNKNPRATVPLHLRNSPTALLKKLGNGKEYQYPHDSAEGYVAGVQYLPSEVKAAEFYQPSNRGYEKTIGERQSMLRSLAVDKNQDNKK
jgi:putative ATPase